MTQFGHADMTNDGSETGHTGNNCVFNKNDSKIRGVNLHAWQDKGKKKYWCSIDGKTVQI